MSHLAAAKAVARAVVHGRLTMADCRLLACVHLIQTVALSAVACASVPAARRALAKLRPWAITLMGDLPEGRVLWAIEASARLRTKSSTCLARALAAESLLQSSDRLRIVIGVTPPCAGRMRAHAWIERDGHVLVGGTASGELYVPLVAWNGVPS